MPCKVIPFNEIIKHPSFSFPYFPFQTFVGLYEPPGQILYFNMGLFCNLWWQFIDTLPLFLYLKQFCGLDPQWQVGQGVLRAKTLLNIYTHSLSCANNPLVVK